MSVSIRLVRLLFLQMTLETCMAGVFDQLSKSEDTYGLIEPTNAEKKMLLPVLVLSGLLQLVRGVAAEELSVIRHADGDIFTAEGSCNGACVELSSGTGSPYSRGTATASNGISITNGTCVCQCNGALPVFREDLHVCVSDVHECNVAGLVSTSGLVEKVPYVFLPQRGQIIYPQSEIRFEGVTTPVCGIAGSQHLGKSGWLELRNLSNAEPPFRLFRDEGRTFLQWIGEDGLRIAAEGKVVVVKLVCRDASPSSDTPVEVFTPCVAFRVAGSPSKSNIREVTFASSGKTSQGLSATEYTAIGVSSVLLALIYVASVSLYLHSRKSRRKSEPSSEEPEVAITGGREGAGLVKNNPLLVASRHFESDENSGQSEDDEAGEDDIAESDGEENFENPLYRSQQVTSAMIHPHCVYVEHPEQGVFGAGTILGERIPEEDVRIVETIENAYQQETPVLPGTQRRKLYFNPAYFERQLLLAPPPAAIEFLMKIREVISIAKHKMTAKRFVPTLTGIPEEETSERCSSAMTKQRATSVQGSVARSRKSQRCTGCPGCTETPTKDLPRLTEVGRPTTGENRVRAWLEDVKTPERRWNHNDVTDFVESTKNFTDGTKIPKILSRGFEHAKEIGRNDFFHAENSNTSGKSFSGWKENPPMLRTFQNIAKSEILGEDDRHSVSKRSTKSMYEKSNYDRYCQAKTTTPLSLGADGLREEGEDDDRENAMSAKVRKAIENSFIKQMEENADMEDRRSATIGSTRKRGRKSRAPCAPTKELPDMINQLPPSKIPAKRIMDAVIRELVDAKALEHNSRQADQAADYEIDSLERTNRKPAGQAQSEARKSAKILLQEKEIGKIGKGNNNDPPPIESPHDDAVSRRNCYNNLPELLTRGREGYSLVSEVYVNDGYASPAGSDDSGPEIRYEPENPGHLTIKVQDSPENYVKQDESEYEPDTLDRKPMRLKINGDVCYERETTSETYVDSLERPRNILLRSRGSFRDDETTARNPTGSLQRGYGSLREIYEARLRSNLKDSSIMSSTRSLNGGTENTLSWKKNRYLTPDSRQAKRQRKPQNHPDVVPLPPSEEIYQKPKPPRRVECLGEAPSEDGGESAGSKNELDRSKRDAGDPTASDGSPVSEEFREENCVGNTGLPTRPEVPRHSDRSANSLDDVTEPSGAPDSRPKWRPTVAPPWKLEFDARARRHLDASASHRPNHESGAILSKSRPAGHLEKKPTEKTGSIVRKMEVARKPTMTLGKVEDSGYLSSTDSNESHKQLLMTRGDNAGSLSETDETESMCDGASESGAESVGTDSVFFGNFRRRLSDASNFSKSVDSGVDFNMRSTIIKPCFNFGNGGTSGNHQEKSSSLFQASDSESESFVTVLTPNGDESRRNSLVS